MLTDVVIHKCVVLNINMTDDFPFTGTGFVGLNSVATA